MTTKRYTTTQIFEHMSPATLVSWLTDLAVAMLKELEGNPILESMIDRYAEDEDCEDEPAIEDDYEWIRRGC